ncbi:MAG: hypothetical protein II897_00230 [Clostridia bacterium]|nr:hypothetical protein [Clostridia bacterium]
METNNIVKNAVEFLLFYYFGLDRKDGNDLDAILDSAIERAYIDATNQGAFNALFTSNVFPDREAVEELKTSVKGMFKIVKNEVKTLYFSYVKVDFNEWHKRICTELITRYREICDELDSPTFHASEKAGEFFTYGNAQKWVNMTIKNLYVISGAYLAMGGTENEAFFNAVAERANEYHIPLDNLILGAVYKQKLIGSDKEYFVMKYGKKDPSYHIVNDDDGTGDSYPWSGIDYPSIYEIFREELEAAIDEPPIEWECRNWISRKKQIRALKGDLTTIDD